MLMKRQSNKNGTKVGKLLMKVDSVVLMNDFFALSVCYICKSFAYMNMDKYTSQ